LGLVAQSLLHNAQSPCRYCAADVMPRLQLVRAVMAQLIDAQTSHVDVRAVAIAERVATRYRPTRVTAFECDGGAGVRRSRARFRAGRDGHS
jgi:hypothetical protein